ncbi:hypothetical protein JCM8208_002371 [Rhodotorula glutinis]
MDPSHRPACLSCAQRRLDNLDCDGGHPCTACRTSSTRCAYPRPSTPPSAWTNIAPQAVQRWPESVQLVHGEAAAFRLRGERNKDGKVDAFRREWVVNQDQDLWLRARRGKTSLLFPASVDDRDEAEALDLEGDPLDFAREGHILLNLHDVLRHDPLQPTVGLNAAIQDRQSSSSSQTRILRAFEPRDPNLGNVLAACDVPLDDGASTSSTCVAFRRAETPGGRPTAVGWGSFAPLPRELRAPSRKGKDREREGDAAAGFRALTEPLFTGAHPIRQVELSRLGSSSSALLGVRTQGSLDLLHLALPPSSSDDPALPPLPTTLSRFSYTASSLSRRPIADFTLSPALGGGLVVDTTGALFGWGLGDRGSGRVGDRDWGGAQPEMFRLRGGRKTGEAGYSGMARVECGGVRGTDAVVAVEDEVLLYDLRSPKASVQLVDPHLLAQHLTHGETDPARVVSLLRRSPSSSDLSLPLPTSTTQHVVATTHDVLYLDERMPSRALLRWKHGRCGPESKGVDLTLSLLEVPTHAGDPPHRDSAEPVVARAALTSRLHPHVELYTTRADPAHAPQIALGPYALEGPRLRSSSLSAPASARPERFTRAGTAFVPLPPPAAAAAPTSSGDAMDVDGASRPSSDEDEDGPAARRERLADERRAARSRSWRLLEAGARGDLSVREVELERFAVVSGDESGEGEAAVGGAAGSVRVELSAELAQLGAEAERALRRTSSRDRRRQKEDERLVDVSRVRRVLEPQRVLEAGRAVDEVGDGDDSPQAAVRLVRGAAEREEGDIGALTGLELLSLSSRHSTAMADDDDVAPEPLPRPTAYDAVASISPESTAALDAALAAAPAALHLRPTQPPTHFSTLLPRHLAPTAAASTASAAERLRALTAERVERHQVLASHILLPRTIEPDEPGRAPNQPQPADEDPPALHFSYLRPKAPTSSNFGDLDGDGDVPGPRRVGRGTRRRKVKGADHDPPSLDSLGARLLLAEWHVGADPRSYPWFSPYDDDHDKDLDALAVSQAQASSSSRRKKREREATKVGGPTSSAMSWQPSFPPSSASYGTSSQSYFPSLAPPQIGSNAQWQSQSQSQSQSQDWPQLAATQPTISVSGPADPSASSQGPPAFGGAASQTVPGAFGSRLTVGAGRGGPAGEKKKKAKKRVSGF